MSLAPQQATDERNFNMMRQLREEYGSAQTLAQFKALVREQAKLLQIDAPRAVAAIPQLLAQDPKLAARTIGDLRRVVTAGAPWASSALAGWPRSSACSPRWYRRRHPPSPRPATKAERGCPGHAAEAAAAEDREAPSRCRVPADPRKRAQQLERSA